MRLDLFIHVLGDPKTGEILIKQGELMAKNIDDLKASVTNLTNASKAILVLLQGIVEKLKECSTVNDFQALTDELDADTKALTDAVVENTPAAEPPSA